MAKKVDALPKPAQGAHRVVVAGVSPEIDAGRFPIKRIIGDSVTIEANIFGDGHDHVAARLLYKPLGEKHWSSTPMLPLGNDRWSGSFVLESIGRYVYTVAGRIDHFDTWRDGFQKKLAAGQDMTLELRNGAVLVVDASKRAKGQEALQLKRWARELEKKSALEAATARALSPELTALVEQFPDTKFETVYERELEIVVDRERARYSTWYEIFPRSASAEAGKHGTFKDVEARLDYVQSLGFDVLYMPPIHPIGRSFRKGKNNSVTAGPGEVGSPWAIGAKEGGHTAILPELGTLADFKSLMTAAQTRGIELALDIAFQCAPDHPWVTEHPDWFKKRADGSIQYAENPPKKYQDIYPLDFESKDWKSLWDELRDVFFYWAEQGVRIFRVDNPHTKAFPFWHWAITEIKNRYPDVLFLAEAFTRPRVMEQLAKAGFSQSYTYFTWRSTKAELTQYATELTQPEPLGTGQWEYFRPNFWPNTPDILPLNLQTGGRAAFMARLVLAATLSSNYGIYGGAFELLEDAAYKPGGEEYLNSEKYELKHWDVESAESLAPFIATVNKARRENAALQSFDRTLRFHSISNDQLICYSKASADGSNVVLTFVNLDPVNRQSGFVYLDMYALGLGDDQGFVVTDALSGASYNWQGPSNYVELNPAGIPAHVFRIVV